MPYFLPFLGSTSFTLGAVYTTVVDDADAFAVVVLSALVTETGLSETRMGVVVEAGKDKGGRHFHVIIMSNSV